MARVSGLGELVDFVEGGVAILVGTASADHAPDAVRGWGATACGDGRAIRLLLPSSASALWSNLASTGRIAVCFTDVATYRSVQVKGGVLELPPAPTAEDEAAWARYRELFFVAVEQGSRVPRSMAVRLLPTEVRPAIVQVDHVFDQTPGPAAGHAIEVAR